MDSFRDRVALVTGAASGIGRGLTLGLAKAGARVIAADIDAAGPPSWAARPSWPSRWMCERP